MPPPPQRSGLCALLRRQPALLQLTVRHSFAQVGVLPTRRDAFRQMLRAAGPQVLALLIQVCDQCRAHPELMEQMLKCVTSWMRHVPLPSDELARSSILAFSFQASPPPRLTAEPCHGARRCLTLPMDSFAGARLASPFRRGGRLSRRGRSFLPGPRAAPAAYHDNRATGAPLHRICAPCAPCKLRVARSPPC